MKKNEMQKILNDAGARHLKVIDRDTIQTIVDGETEIFTRSDIYSGHPLSGLAYFGSVYGDHRMIQAIADDITTAFELINPKN